jgi:PAS domain S-box-containing protein
LNEVALDYLGFSLADHSGDVFRARVVHPDDLKKLHEKRHRALASGMPFEGEQRVRDKDGKYRWFVVRYRPLKDEKGRVVRWYDGAMDIKDRKRSEEALRRNKACLLEAQRLTHTSSWATDVTSGEPLYWSEENFRIWCFDPQEGLPDCDTIVQRAIQRTATGPRTLRGGSARR